jgi:diguanylate cyclase (GGDEF)-like protein
VLVSVARLLIMHLRQTDMIARYGGEEFLAVLPGIGTDAMYRLFVRVLETLRNTKHVVKTGETLRVTASIGLAAHLDRGYRFESYEALVLAADQMVYAAKRRGRDEIVIYPGNNEVVPPA